MLAFRIEIFSSIFTNNTFIICIIVILFTIILIMITLKVIISPWQVGSLNS